MEILLWSVQPCSLRPVCPSLEEQAVLSIQGLLILLCFPRFSVCSQESQCALPLFPLQLKPKKSCQAQSCQGSRINRMDGDIVPSGCCCVSPLICPACPRPQKSKQDKTMPASLPGEFLSPPPFTSPPEPTPSLQQKRAGWMVGPQICTKKLWKLGPAGEL